jgi:(1->4)-alpha-D-glucan 1-alpha-D-glucosylmutase
LEDGRLKLFVTACLTRLRRANEDFFQRAGYAGLTVEGAMANHVVAFARSFDRRSVIVAAGRFFASLSDADSAPVGEDVWKDTIIPLFTGIAGGVYTDVLSGASIELLAAEGRSRVPLSQAFSSLPLAILMQEGHLKTGG